MIVGTLGLAGQPSRSRRELVRTGWFGHERFGFPGRRSNSRKSERLASPSSNATWPTSGSGQLLEVHVDVPKAHAQTSLHWRELLAISDPNLAISDPSWPAQVATSKSHAPSIISRSMREIQEPFPKSGAMGGEPLRRGGSPLASVLRTSARGSFEKRVSGDSSNEERQMGSSGIPLSFRFSSLPSDSYKPRTVSSREVRSLLRD